jgi:hypothetical protein
MRNLVALTALMILVAASGSEQAIAAGAVAIGIAPGGVANGYASGYEVNAPDIATASREALAQCKKPQANASGTPANSGTLAAQAKCEVVMTFQDKCYAQALDPKDGTPGAGWAVADTEADADAQALAKCKATAGADRVAFCKVFNSDCDGGAH